MPSLAAARLWFCSNSFNPRRTRLQDVLRAEWIEGPAAAKHPWPRHSEIAGAIAFAAARPDWHLTLLRCASAPVGGPLAAEVLGAWLADVSSGLQAGHFDALYLSLCGACQVEGDPASDLSVLRTLRRRAPRLPIVATLDARASLSEEIPLLLDGASVVGGPDDGAKAAERTLTLLEGLLAGRWRPVGAVARPPVRLAVGDKSGKRQARSMPAGAEAVLAAPTLLESGICHGFPWVDAPHGGPAALAWADRDAHTAREAAAALALRLPFPHAPDVLSNVPGDTPALAAAEAVARAAELGRTLLLDVADDPDLGGHGDTPALPGALLEAAVPAACGVLAAPGLHAAAVAAGEGALVEIALGGSSPLFGPSVHARGRVLRVLETVAVLAVGPVSLLVADAPTRATPELFAAAGIDPSRLSLLAIKGGHQTAGAFARFFPHILAVLCPGPTTPRLGELPFTYRTARRTPHPAALRGMRQAREA